MAELSDELLTRLRQIVSGGTVTEAELRAVSDRAAGLARLLAAQVEGSEQRLGELSRDPESSLAETAAELRRVETLRPALLEVRGLLVALDQRARELRTEWLLHQAADAGGPGEAAVVTRPAVP